MYELPNNTLYFTIGTDNLKELSTWWTAEELVSKYKILVIERDEDISKVQSIATSNRIFVIDFRDVVTED